MGLFIFIKKWGIKSRVEEKKKDEKKNILDKAVSLGKNIKNHTGASKLGELGKDPALIADIMKTWLKEGEK